jgi:hypothetical protein
MTLPRVHHSTWPWPSRVWWRWSTLIAFVNKREARSERSSELVIRCDRRPAGRRRCGKSEAAGPVGTMIVFLPRPKALTPVVWWWCVGDGGGSDGDVSHFCTQEIDRWERASQAHTPRARAWMGEFLDGWLANCINLLFDGDLDVTS